jgi:hypothetical protein
MFLDSGQELNPGREQPAQHDSTRFERQMIQPILARLSTLEAVAAEKRDLLAAPGDLVWKHPNEPGRRENGQQVPAKDRSTVEARELLEIRSMAVAPALLNWTQEQAALLKLSVLPRRAALLVPVLSKRRRSS